MKKILIGLEPCFWVASFILLIYWVCGMESDFNFDKISGWWWFSTVMVGTFLSEFNSNTYD